MNEICRHCGSASGSSIVCGSCLKTVLSNKYLRRKYDRIYQQLGTAAAGWICSYCGVDFSRSERMKALVCIDHIKPKGSHPRLRYDLLNGRCTCCAGGNNCHDKRGRGLLKADRTLAENMTLSSSMKLKASRPKCSHLGCSVTPLSNNRCPFHQHESDTAH